MDKRKFLIVLFLLAVITFCWTAGQAAAQGGKSQAGKREASWNSLEQWLPERAKGDAAYQKYLAIYNARMQAQFDGTLLGKGKQSPRQINPKGVTK